MLPDSLIVENNTKLSKVLLFNGKGEDVTHLSMMFHALSCGIVLFSSSCFSFAMFHHVRIPRENLLNKTGDVAPDGRYVTPFKVSRQLPWSEPKLSVFGIHLGRSLEP